MVILHYAFFIMHSSFFILHSSFFITQRAQPHGHALILNSEFLILNWLIAEAADGNAWIHAKTFCIMGTFKARSNLHKVSNVRFSSPFSNRETYCGEQPTSSANCFCDMRKSSRDIATTMAIFRE